MVAMINSRSLVYTSPPTTHSDQYRITIGTYIYNKQNPMSILDLACTQKIQKKKKNNHQEISKC